MAKEYITCATPDCTNKIVIIEKNRKEAERKAQWAVGRYHCQDCEEKSRQAANAQAAQQNASKGLPVLTGSEKQIAWAEKIRADKLATLESLSEVQGIQFHGYWDFHHLRDVLSTADKSAIDACRYDLNQAFAVCTQLPYIKRGFDLLANQTKAAWWIDNRDSKLSFLVAALILAAPAEPSPVQKALEIDARIEATVRPETPKTETVAEITPQSDMIVIKFPEKRESFRQLMHEYGYSWSGSAWQRKITQKNGPLADRAQEIGFVLLGAGFIIRIYDENLRHNAINGTYQPEQTRWISRCTAGSYTGWFFITWGRDEDYYRAARRLHRSQYNKPGVVIPAEFWEEVQDFADVNQFCLSVGALDLIEEAKFAQQQALVAKVEPVKRQKRKKLSEKPQVLAVPEQVAIDHDLLDD